MTDSVSMDMHHPGMSYPETSFLRFGTWSVLLHVGVIALLSFLHFSHSVEKSRPLVKVTLIETQAPEPKEAEPQAPPMLQTQRRQKPVQPQQIVPLQQVRLPAQLPQIAKVIPQPPPQQAPAPLKRRILQDERASDTLRLKNFTKVARSDLPPTKTKTTVQNPSMTIPALSAIAALRGISTKVPPLPSPSTFASDTTTKTLRSVATSEGPLKTNAGLGRTIPPVYPRIAKQSGWEGTVLLRVAVQPNGRPDTITVQRSSGYEVLDKAAMNALKRWRFHPAKDGNIPIRSLVEIPIKFSLTKQRS